MAAPTSANDVLSYLVAQARFDNEDERRAFLDAIGRDFVEPPDPEKAKDDEIAALKAQLAAQQGEATPPPEESDPYPLSGPPDVA